MTVMVQKLEEQKGTVAGYVLSHLLQLLEFLTVILGLAKLFPLAQPPLAYSVLRLITNYVLIDWYSHLGVSNGGPTLIRLDRCCLTGASPLLFPRNLPHR